MSKERPSYIPESQWIEDLPSYVYKVAHEYLPLREWDFHESYRNEKLLIFDSEFCRIKLLSYWDSNNQWSGAYEVSIYYGKLHAPDRDMFIQHENGEKAACWLEPSWNYVLEYISYAFPERQRPLRRDIFKEFLLKKKEFPSRIHWRLAIESEVWKYYIPELFYLFDIRRPELWEQYRAWLKARYIAEGRKEEEDERQGLIPYYRVC